MGGKGGEGHLLSIVVPEGDTNCGTASVPYEVSYIACSLHSTAPVPLMQVPAQGKNAGMVGGPDTDA